ncbi:MAG: hypothetical protein KGL39_44270, partial [Patescibacteria group bacterium]|nr:hypothetical protein [Patescibacteria group bacterium]
MDDDWDVTEFTYLNPQEMHLVGMGANGFAPLLAKAAQAVDDILTENEAEKGSVFSTFCGEGPVVKFVSAATRRRMASEGSAMPNGDFPIADEGHLRSAIGHLGGYTGDKAAAKRHIIKRARALGLTHMLPKEWNVSKATNPVSDALRTAADEFEKSTASTSESLSQTEEVSQGGGPVHTSNGHAAGKPPEAAYSQPRPAVDSGEGDTAPTKDVPTDGSLTQTRNRARKATTDNGNMDDECEEDDDNTKKAAPGSPEWERKDVQLAKNLVSKLEDALSIAQQFETRESAEAIKSNPLSVALQDARDKLNSLMSGHTSPPVAAVTKEIDMTRDELFAAFEEWEAKKAQAAGTAPVPVVPAEAPSGGSEVEKGAEMAAKSAFEFTPESLAALIGGAVEKGLAPVQERLAAAEALLEKTPAHQVLLNPQAAAVAPHPVDPTQMGKAASSTFGGAFAPLETELAKAIADNT